MALTRVLVMPLDVSPAATAALSPALARAGGHRGPVAGIVAMLANVRVPTL